ncbi:hydrolase [Niallia sp. XMNu-256]|uniref:hydrolase n=1 Tax=Niallia sp. XMNu-256 TaxID=3082444 RepID=UPI0030D1A6C4
MEGKKTYYINISSGEISQSLFDSPWNFQIEATPNEIQTLRQYFDENEAGDFPNFLRAHIPFREYHYDEVNDRQDEALQQIYEFIYQRGDEETKQLIDSMNILKNK